MARWLLRCRVTNEIAKMRRKLNRVKTGRNDILNIATWNIRGIAEKAKRQVIVQIMNKKKIDTLCLQETWMNTNSQEQVDGYNFVFSTSVDNKDREERIKKQQSAGRARGKGKSRGICKGKTDLTGLERTV